MAESHAGVEQAEEVQAELEKELAKAREAMARVSGSLWGWAAKLVPGCVAVVGPRLCSHGGYRCCLPVLSMLTGCFSCNMISTTRQAALWPPEQKALQLASSCLVMFAKQS